MDARVKEHRFWESGTDEWGVKEQTRLMKKKESEQRDEALAGSLGWYKRQNLKKRFRDLINKNTTHVHSENKNNITNAVETQQLTNCS